MHTSFDRQTVVFVQNVSCQFKRKTRKTKQTNIAVKEVNGFA